MIKLIIFDLDGTLVNAYRAIQKSLNYARRKYGYPLVSLAVVRRNVGWGDRKFVEVFFKKKDLEGALEIYRNHHRASLLKYARMVPEAKKLLITLKRKKIKLAIASNRPPRFTKILLKRMGLKKYFGAVSCAKDKTEIKPKPIVLLRAIQKLKVRKTEALYVGDMVIDVEAGRRAGILTIAVLGGSSSPASLRKAKPYKVIPKISYLLKIL